MHDLDLFVEKIIVEKNEETSIRNELSWKAAGIESSLSSANAAVHCSGGKCIPKSRAGLIYTRFGQNHTAYVKPLPQILAVQQQWLLEKKKACSHIDTSATQTKWPASRLSSMYRINRARASSCGTTLLLLLLLAAPTNYRSEDGYRVHEFSRGKISAIQ